MKAFKKWKELFPHMEMDPSKSAAQLVVMFPLQSRCTVSIFVFGLFDEGETIYWRQEAK